MDRITRPSAATGVPSCSIAAVIAAVITATSWVSSVFPETTGAGFSAGFAAGADGAAFSLRHWSEMQQNPWRYNQTRRQREIKHNDRSLYPHSS